MIRTARRNLSVYSAILAMIPKQFMAYQLWFWISLVLSVISMAIPPKATVNRGTGTEKEIEPRNT